MGIRERRRKIEAELACRAESSPRRDVGSNNAAVISLGGLKAALAKPED
jgi:hypothetical protein